MHGEQAAGPAHHQQPLVGPRPQPLPSSGSLRLDATGPGPELAHGGGSPCRLSVWSGHSHSLGELTMPTPEAHSTAVTGKTPERTGSRKQGSTARPASLQERAGRVRVSGARASKMEPH